MVSTETQSSSVVRGVKGVSGQTQPKDPPKESLTINPAFMQEIKDGNPELWQTQHQLRQLCDQERSRNDTTLLNQVAPLLCELREQLALQFSLEESYGFQVLPQSEAANESLEWLSGLIVQAKNQHYRLYLDATELSESANELQYRGSEPNDDQFELLKRKVLTLDESLRQHEKFEGELVDHAFDLA